MPTCATCPSRLGEEKLDQRFGETFGPNVEWCAQHGHVLGRPGLSTDDQRKVYLSFSQGCGSYGEAPVDLPKIPYPQGQVCGPHPSVFLDDGGQPRRAPTTEEREAVRSCRDCRWLVPSKVVKTELGWQLPLCGATGRLLFSKRLRLEPGFCGQSRPGPGLTTTEDMVLRPEYQDVFEAFGRPAPDPVAAFIARAGAQVIEPADYVSDRPVVDEERAEGIRAWRRIENPDRSGRYVDLPIFDVGAFDESAQTKIPRTGDDEHPEWYVDHDGLLYDLAAEMQELEETPVLIGGAGVGKTEAFRHLAWLMGLPFDRISITRSSEVDDLAGKWLFEDGGTRWQDGRLSRCWQTPGVLVIDEPNVGPDEVWQLIRPLTDNSKQLVLDAARGQRIERHPWRYLGLAMNPAWDMKYVGTNDLNVADSDRLSPIEVSLPPDDIERMIVVQRCMADGYEISGEVLDTIMNISRDLRAASDPEAGSLPISWGLRPNIKVARKTAVYSLEKAYRRAIADFLDPIAREMVMQVVRQYAA